MGDAGDEAKLGQAAVGGRKEGEEGERRGDGAEQQRPAGYAGRLDQRRGRRQATDAALLRAQGKVDAEVDAEADEQHGEGDRDDVQLADGDRKSVVQGKSGSARVDLGGGRTI